MFENDNIVQIRRKFEDFYYKGNLAGSWLFTGEKGIGKASLAISLTKFILGGGKYDNDINIMIDNKVFPDLLYIERDFTETEKKDIVKTLNAGKLSEDTENRKKNTDITVNDIRKIDDFMYLKSVTGWKVIIIDSADEMNVNAANAALKSIEEPTNNCVIFLISHNSARLLPTILSRCRKVNFPLFSYTEAQEAIKRKYTDISMEEAEIVAKMGVGSIGKSIFLYENDAVAIFKEFIDIFKTFPKLNRLAVYNFASKCDKDDIRYNITIDIFLKYIEKIIKYKASATIDNASLYSEDEGELLYKMAASSNVEKLLDLYNKSQYLFNKTKALYLDRKQTLINLILELELC